MPRSRSALTDQLAAELAGQGPTHGPGAQVLPALHCVTVAANPGATAQVSLVLQQLAASFHTEEKKTSGIVTCGL